MLVVSSTVMVVGLSDPARSPDHSTKTQPGSGTASSVTVVPQSRVPLHGSACATESTITLPSPVAVRLSACGSGEKPAVTVL